METTETNGNKRETLAEPPITNYQPGSSHELRRSSSSLIEPARFPFPRPPPPPPPPPHAPFDTPSLSFDLSRTPTTHTNNHFFSSSTSLPTPAPIPTPQLFPNLQPTQQQAVNIPDHRHPVVTHQDNWLDRTAAAQRDDDPFGYFPDFLFEGFFDDREVSPPSDSQPTPLSNGDVYSLPSLDDSDHQQFTNFAMPSQPHHHHHHHAHHRSSVQPNVVDLTGVSSSPPDTASRRAENRKRSAEPSASSSSSASAGPAWKRGRMTSEKVEEVDLTNEALSSEEKLRQAQQQEAIRSQQAAEEGKGPQKIGRRQCIICMENYTDATTTACGHFYCHECLIQALMAGEKNSDRHVGSCPVCRKAINRKKQHQVIPISFMKRGNYEKNYRPNRSLIG